MVRIPVKVGPLSFATKREAGEHFRVILYRHEIGQRIPDPDAAELEWLLERHSEAADKIGSGVDYFSVRDAIYGTRCFEVARVDGTATDFSFKNCVDGKAPSAQARVLDALRAAVTPDILDKKCAWFETRGDREGKLACAITGAMVSFEAPHQLRQSRLAPARLRSTSGRGSGDASCARQLRPHAGRLRS